MDRVEAAVIPAAVLERVILVELVAAVVRLRPVVDTDDVEPGLLVALRAATGTAEQIKQTRLHNNPHALAVRGHGLNPATRQ
jgi:hypothetical protein